MTVTSWFGSFAGFKIGDGFISKGGLDDNSSCLIALFHILPLWVPSRQIEEEGEDVNERIKLSAGKTLVFNIFPREEDKAKGFV